MGPLPQLSAIATDAARKMYLSLKGHYYGITG